MNVSRVTVSVSLWLYAAEQIELLNNNFLKKKNKLDYRQYNQSDI